MLMTECVESQRAADNEHSATHVYHELGGCSGLIWASSCIILTAIRKYLVTKTNTGYIIQLFEPYVSLL